MLSVFKGPKFGVPPTFREERHASTLGVGCEVGGLTKSARSSSWPSWLACQDFMKCGRS